ncbi:MAG: DUF6491 family protein [Steroidobacteraceae bacterium]|jgi:hypothetical protein
MTRTLSLAIALGGFAAGAAPQIALAADPAPAPEARIAFADRHGINDWRVVNDQTVLIQSRDHTWYKATLLGHCNDLPFAEHLGFKTNADGSFDRFGEILLHHQHCPLVSLIQTAAPDKKIAPKNATVPAPAPRTPANPPAV